MKKFVRRFGKIVLLVVVLLLVFTGWQFYKKHISRTRIAFVNYPSFVLARIQKAGDTRWVTVENVTAEEIGNKARGYDAVFLFGRGLNLSPETLTNLRNAGYAGLPVYVEAATNPNMDVTSVKGQALDHIADYLRNGGNINYRNLLHYVRSKLNGKSWFADTAAAPVAVSADVLFHLDEDKTFASVEAYESYIKAQHFYTPGGAKIALLTSVPGPFNANRDHLDAMISMFQLKGWNVYPVASTSKRLAFLQQINPDIVVEMPHGRVSLGDADRVVAWLKEKNIPMLSPVSVFSAYDKWKNDPQGMSGALLTMSIVSPELDGGVAPYAIAAQYKDENGYDIFKAIPDRLDKFAGLVEKWLALKKKPNSEKKIAIYYFKGPGLTSLVASNMEVVSSLYNTLLHLQSQGYKVDNLPADAKALEQLIMQSGSVLNPYAEGTIDRFFKNGNPALVETGTYESWVKQSLPANAYSAVEKKYGKAPGDYMMVSRDNKTYLGVARIQFGNIVLLPQPLPAIGDNTFKIIHGAKVAPTHPYIASYLWVRNSFNADAIVHFGTHGSLEFTPGKQVALNNDDWSDALIGNTPHFYVYTISNVGEAIIAKRRTYATILSHLTPPFMEGGVYNELAALEEMLHKWAAFEEGAVKNEYLKSVSAKAKELKLYKDLGADESKELTSAQAEHLQNLVEEISNEKVNSGLYTIGKPYSENEAARTAKLMCVDAISYGLARLDILKKQAPENIVNDRVRFDARYRTRAMQIIDARLRTGDTSLDNVIAPADIERAAQYAQRNTQPGNDELVRGFIAMGNGSRRPATGSGTSAGTRGGIPPAKLAALQKVVVKILSDNRKVAFVNELKSDKRFKDATSLLDPETMANAKKIAKAIPKMREGIAIAEQPDVMALITLMQDEKIRQKTFELLEDKSLQTRVAEQKKILADSLVRLAATPEKQASLKLVALPAYDQYSIEQLKTLEADLRFFNDNRAQLNGLPAKTVIDSSMERIATALVRAEGVERRFAGAVNDIRTAVQNIKQYKEGLIASSGSELAAIDNALTGGYTLPSTGGDPITTPSTVPTGRNLYSIDAEKTPGVQAWNVGVKLAKELLKQYQAAHGGIYPKKVAVTLWPGDFIQTEGALLAEVFYLLGVEPVRDPFGRVMDIQLIPAGVLQRPRIDVVVQTAGQFRDLAASRIQLINKAVEMAAAAKDANTSGNYVSESVQESEQLLKQKGLSPKEAKELAGIRVFGGVNGNYGTGIMGMVESSDKYNDNNDVAKVYLNNMGAAYNSGEQWAVFREGMLEAALQHTDVVVQPRESNTWGPLSLDHVYEFMGGLNNAVRYTTGKEPDAVFNDFRNPSEARVQELKEAIWVEARSTLLNPAYIKEMMKGGSSSAEKFAETFRNTFGWNVMKANVIDGVLWDELHAVYVKDKLNTGVHAFFESQSPAALEEMTGVMMEAARKGLWKAGNEQLKDIAALHGKLVTAYGAGCSEFVCGNEAVKKEMLRYMDNDVKEGYTKNIRAALSAGNDDKSVVLKKEQSAKNDKQPVDNNAAGMWWTIGAIVTGLLLLMIVIRELRNKKDA